MPCVLYNGHGTVSLVEASANAEEQCIKCGNTVEDNNHYVVFGDGEEEGVYCEIGCLTALFDEAAACSTRQKLGQVIRGFMYGTGERLPTAKGNPCAVCGNQLAENEKLYLLQDYSQITYVAYHVACWEDMEERVRDAAFSDTADIMLGELL